MAKTAEGASFVEVETESIQQSDNFRVKSVFRNILYSVSSPLMSEG